MMWCTSCMERLPGSCRRMCSQGVTHGSTIPDQPFYCVTLTEDGVMQRSDAAITPHLKCSHTYAPPKRPALKLNRDMQSCNSHIIFARTPQCKGSWSLFINNVQTERIVKARFTKVHFSDNFLGVPVFTMPLVCTLLSLHIDSGAR